MYIYTQKNPYQKKSEIGFEICLGVIKFQGGHYLILENLLSKRGVIIWGSHLRGVTVQAKKSGNYPPPPHIVNDQSLISPKSTIFSTRKVQVHPIFSKKVWVHPGFCPKRVRVHPIFLKGSESTLFSPQKSSSPLIFLAQDSRVLNPIKGPHSSRIFFTPLGL